MPESSSICSPALLRRFVDDQLDESERQMLEAHLDECAACQEKLTDASADPEWWRETRKYLGEAVLDNGVQETLSFLNPTDDPRMMGRFDGYEIAGIIGQGGMGVVLKGYDKSLNRYSALKVLAPQLATRGSARTRFAREAQAAAAVVHDNVISIRGVSEAAGLPYLAMPYVRGESLQKRIDRDGAMSPTEVVRVAHQIASGLAAAHAQGLVHRDIKPANILLPQGVQRVLITDFGLARAVDDSNLTGTGIIAGTPQFMSPEQARGESVDARSDLFSLGTVMYAMCTGRNPFRAENPFGVLRRIIDDSPRSIRELNPEIPDWLESLVNQLHRKSREDRFQSAAELAILLEKCLAHLQDKSAPLPVRLKTSGLKETLPGFKSLCWLIGIVATGFAGFCISGWIPGFEQTDSTAHKEVSVDQEEGKQTDDSSRNTNNGVIPPGESDQQESGNVLATPQEPGENNPKREEHEALKETLLSLSNQIDRLSQEENFLGAREVELKMLTLLKEMDKDHLVSGDKRKLMIQARLDGEHELANALAQEITNLQVAISERYSEIDRIMELQVKALPIQKMRMEKAALLEADKVDEALQKGREIESFIKQLESDYYARKQAKENARLSEDELRDKVLELAMNIEKQKLQHRLLENQVKHEEQLVARGFMKAEAVTKARLVAKHAAIQMEAERKKLIDLLGIYPAVVARLLVETDTYKEGVTIPIDDHRAVKAIITALKIEQEELKQKLGPSHPKLLSITSQIEHWESLLTDLKYPHLDRNKYLDDLKR